MSEKFLFYTGEIKEKHYLFGFISVRMWVRTEINPEAFRR